eukprot:jgi/Hompol1/1538/HPOL_005619-RA
MSVSQLPSARLLRGSVVDSFAYSTIKDRLPVILTKIIDHISRLLHQDGANMQPDEIQDAKMIMERISSLKYAMVRDRPIQLLDPYTTTNSSGGGDDDDGALAADIAEWNASLTDIDEAERTWFKAPWLLIECYMYRLLRQAVLSAQTPLWRDYDLFGSDKRASLAGSLVSVFQLAQGLQLQYTADTIASPSRSVLCEMIHFSLWGNKSDLSLLVHANHNEMHKSQVSGRDQLASSNQHIIVNDDDRVVDRLLSIHDGTIVFVLDNAGFELFGDLCLADYLTQTTTCTIVFETKMYPWFVSDTTIRDFYFTLDECERVATAGSTSSSNPTGDEANALLACVKRWRSWLRQGRWSLREDPFWTTPHPFWKLPLKAPQLLDRLSEARFIFFKGDLNYRKMVHDAAWPTSTSLTEAIGPLANTNIAPFVLLRTCKSDTVVGLAEGQEQALDKIDKNWMVNGKFGMIQLYDGSLSASL